MMIPAPHGYVITICVWDKQSLLIEKAEEVKL